MGCLRKVHEAARLPPVGKTRDVGFGRQRLALVTVTGGAEPTPRTVGIAELLLSAETVALWSRGRICVILEVIPWMNVEYAVVPTMSTTTA